MEPIDYNMVAVKRDWVPERMWKLACKGNLVAWLFPLRELLTRAVRATCSHPPDKVTKSWWGHEAAEVYDCECGEMLMPGGEKYAEWCERHGLSPMKGNLPTEANGNQT